MPIHTLRVAQPYCLLFDLSEPHVLSENFLAHFFGVFNKFRQARIGERVLQKTKDRLQWASTHMRTSGSTRDDMINVPYRRREYPGLKILD